jgi:hypothetical protein
MTTRYDMIDPINVFFTHSRIRPFFSGCGRRIIDTLSDIESGRLQLEMLPVITILENGIHLFSLNNRRLYVLKQLRMKGFLPNNTIRVRIKQANTQESSRYVATKCSLHATIMKEYKKDDGNNDNNNDDDNNDDISDNDEHVNNYDTNHNDQSPTNKKKTKSNCNDGDNMLDPKITSSLKGLMKLVDKGKFQQVEQQFLTWLAKNQINDHQKRYILEEIGMT